MFSERLFRELEKDISCFDGIHSSSFIREANKEGVKFLVGFEIEFVLVDAKDYSFVNEGRWCAADCMPSGSDVVKVLDEVMEALEVAGVEVFQYHAEAALSQVNKPSSYYYYYYHLVLWSRFDNWHV